MRLLPLLLLSFVSAAQAEAIKVKVQPLSEIATYPTYHFPASVVSHVQADLSSELNARLLSVEVLPGQFVEKGDLLAKFDCRDAKDSLALIKHREAEAESRLALTQLQLERFKNLESRQYTATSQIDETQTQLEGIKASLAGLQVEKRVAKRTVQRCQLKAPYDGVISAKKASKGQWLGMGTPVVTLVKTSDSEIKTFVPQHFALNELTNNFQWRAETSAAKSIPLKRVSDMVSGNQGMVAAWFEAPSFARVGELGHILVQANQRHLKPNYVVQRDNQFGVFVLLPDNTVGFKNLPMSSEGRQVAVPKDWPEALKVVTVGQLRLQSGDQVAVENP